MEYVLILFLIIAGYSDITYGRIPNLITFPVIFAAIVLNYLFLGLNGLTDSIIGLLVGTVLFLPFFIIKGIGGGDLKLFAAIGALKGYSFLLQSIVFSLFIAVLISLLILFKNKELTNSLNKVLRFFRSFVVPGLKTEHPDGNAGYPVPFGLAISIGTLIVLLRNL